MMYSVLLRSLVRTCHNSYNDIEGRICAGQLACPVIVVALFVPRNVAVRGVHDLTYWCLD